MPTKRIKNNWSSSIAMYKCCAAAFVLNLMLFSCNSPIYDHTIEIEPNGWSEQQVLSFEFDVQDTSKLYNVFLEIDHNVSYAYQNLYCVVEAYSPEGLVQQQQSSIELANKKGYWLGECSGENCIRTIPLIDNTKFDLLGRHQIDLKEYSRPEALAGLKSFRLYVEEVPSK